MPASAAARATFTSGTAVPARMRLPGSGVMVAKPLPKRMTTPGTPPSRTKQVGAEADDGDGKVGRDAGEEVGEVGFIGRREQGLRRSADAEPRDVGELGSGGKAPAQIRQLGLQVGADIGKRQRAPPGLTRWCELNRVGATRLFGGEPIGERVRPFGRGAGAEADDHVVGTDHAAQQRPAARARCRWRSPTGGRSCGCLRPCSAGRCPAAAARRPSRAAPR